VIGRVFETQERKKERKKVPSVHELQKERNLKIIVKPKNQIIRQPPILEHFGYIP